MTTKKITSVADLAGILRTIFLLKKNREQLPIRITDTKGAVICDVTFEDEYKWVETPYSQSFAFTKKLCTKEEWNKMTPAQQVELCDCWDALAIFEYLHVAYDKGRRFRIRNYEC